MIGLASSSPLLAASRAEALLESVGPLEECAVKLHRAYASWLRDTGQFEGRSEDSLYASLCTFRNSCRAVAWRVRSKDVPQLYWTQVEAIGESLDFLGRYREYQTLDPALQELMRTAWTVARSFRGSYHSVVASEVISGSMAAIPRPQRNSPRIGPLRLLPNRFDIMSFLENRWAAR